MSVSPDTTFTPQTMGDDLLAVQRMYADFFGQIKASDWDKPSKRGAAEWTMHETVAHLCALNGAGLDSIKHRLRGEPYEFEGLTDRYVFNEYNQKGIEEQRHLTQDVLCNKFLEIHGEAAAVAGSLEPEEAQMTSQMPIYNRPLQIVEALGIIFIHAGIFHTAQVAEPAGQEPLWQQLAPEIRHRGIGRVMRALSLLYRYDLGGDLRATIMFEVDGPGGGHWVVEVSPEAAVSRQGTAEKPDLTVRLRDIDLFCRMFTGRMNLPVVLLTRRLRLSGDWRLFLRFGSLFSVDARK